MPQIDLSKEDIELISEALESHERISLSDNAMSEVIATIAAGDHRNDPRFIADRESAHKKAELKAIAMKRKCLMLRARLYEMSLRSSEF